MKRKERKEKVAQMTNPVRQILGCGFFFWLLFLFFFLPFFECFSFFFFLLPDFLGFYYYYYFLFSFGLFLVLFMLSLCFWRHHLFPLCYQELSRKVNMSATASPSVLCGHLLTEGNRCRLSKDQSCLRFPASPLPSGSGFLPHFSPNISPMHAFFVLLFFFPLSFSFLVLHKRDLLSYGIAQSGLKGGCKLLEWNLCPWQLLSAQVNSAWSGRVWGRRWGSGSAVLRGSRVRSHQKPARSNSKLSLEPRQHWGASSQDFLSLLFLPTTFSVSFAPVFLCIYMYICAYILIKIYIHAYIYIYIYTENNCVLFWFVLFLMLSHFAFWPAGRGKE